jgi:hypothetical protein
VGVANGLRRQLEQTLQRVALLAELIIELQQKSARAEQSLLDLIEGIGHLFATPRAPVEASQGVPGHTQPPPQPVVAARMGDLLIRKSTGHAADDFHRSPRAVG